MKPCVTVSNFLWQALADKEAPTACGRQGNGFAPLAGMMNLVTSRSSAAAPIDAHSGAVHQAPGRPNVRKHEIKVSCPSSGPQPAFGKTLLERVQDAQRTRARDVMPVHEATLLHRPWQLPLDTLAVPMRPPTLAPGHVGEVAPVISGATLPAAHCSWANDWFRHAIIYQLRVDCFADGTGRGHGDLRGALARLDHIASVANTVWLPPVCRSPMRDGRYDPSDYLHVDPALGSDAECDALIAACHARGMHVIAELVGNHSSVEHPWFIQESLYRKTYAELRALDLPPIVGQAVLRGDPVTGSAAETANAWVQALELGPATAAAVQAGYYSVAEQRRRLAALLYGSTEARAESLAGDFYLWTEDPEHRFREAFLAFPDDYASVWARDPGCGHYYYHSFFDHQADLNYRSPRLRATMEDVIRHWVKRGVDGLRIDAAPFFWKEEGTSCMNLPGMHALFQSWRAMLEREAPHVVLLAEAVQPPEHLRSYFGTNNECHMMFNAPLAEALFHALARERAQPLNQAIQRIAQIPPQAQLVTFLRNHDEFYTAWLPEAEEKAVWERFAPDPAHRVHHGVRRRLASMVNDAQALRMLVGLLYSLPGSPTIYYGDEIGMGDRFTEPNAGPIYDRDAVRTPMQWTDSSNAGFSKAQALANPPIAEGPFNYHAVNVARQDSDPASLLNWHRDLAKLRAQMPLFALGDLEMRDTSNPCVVAFTRTYHGEQVLVLANLSRKAQTLPFNLPAGAQSLLQSQPVIAGTSGHIPPVTLQIFTLRSAP